MRILATALFVVLAGHLTAAPDVKDLVWNKYDTKNFTVLSIDENQGKYLYGNAGKVKSWLLTRWGLQDVDFAVRVRMFCVPKKDQMKSLFKLDGSKIEFRKDLTVMWLLCDDKPSRCLTGPLTEVCITEYERRAGVALPWWCHRGMARLNGTFDDIKSDLGSLGPAFVSGEPVYQTQAILSMTEVDYLKLPPDRQSLFDRQSAAMLLLIRKEHGQDKTLKMIHRRGTPEDTLTAVLNFKGYRQFDAAYTRYVKDLANDIISRKTPESYLDVRQNKK